MQCIYSTVQHQYTTVIGMKLSTKIYKRLIQINGDDNKSLFHNSHLILQKVKVGYCSSSMSYNKHT